MVYREQMEYGFGSAVSTVELSEHLSLNRLPQQVPHSFEIIDQIIIISDVRRSFVGGFLPLSVSRELKT